MRDSFQELLLEQALVGLSPPLCAHAQMKNSKFFSILNLPTRWRLVKTDSVSGSSDFGKLVLVSTALREWKAKATEMGVAKLYIDGRERWVFCSQITPIWVPTSAPSLLVVQWPSEKHTQGPAASWTFQSYLLIDIRKLSCNEYTAGDMIDSFIRPTKLLNYMTAPDTVIWSALLASAAVPGILNPVVLMQKLKDGSIVPWSWGSRFKDGSLRYAFQCFLGEFSQCFKVSIYLSKP